MTVTRRMACEATKTDLVMNVGLLNHMHRELQEHERSKEERDRLGQSRKGMVLTMLRTSFLLRLRLCPLPLYLPHPPGKQPTDPA